MKSSVKINVMLTLSLFICALGAFLLWPGGARAAGKHEVTVGDFNLTADRDLVASADYEYDDTRGVLTIMTSEAITIANKVPGDTTTKDTIVVDSSVKDGKITLDGLNIDVSANYGRCAFSLKNSANVSLTLKDSSDNSLKSGADYAGLEVPEHATLTLGGSGTLNVTGGTSGTGFNPAGIGARSGKSGNITITGGIVTATSLTSGAGIGGNTDNGTITIEGGIVTAKGGGHGAGIGGGENGAGGTIKITGGSVTATGGTSGAGIGGGLRGAGGNVTIDGGSVNATGGGGDAQNIGNGSGNTNPFTLKTSRPVQNTELSTKPVILTLENNANPNQAVTWMKVGDYVGADKTTGFGEHEYGIHDMKTDAEGKVYLYLPEGDIQADTTASLRPDGPLLYSGKFNNPSPDERKATLTAQSDLENLDLSTLGEGQNLYIWDDRYGVGADVDGAKRRTKEYGGDYTLSGGTDKEPIQNSVTVMADYQGLDAEGNPAKTITLNGLHIQFDAGQDRDRCAFSLERIVETSPSVSLKLEANSTNTLASGADSAGLQVPDTAALTLGGSGSLKATGGIGGAGIGGCNSNNGSGKITITGGSVTATSSSQGAGIGGGESGGGGTITITGGSVTAEGNLGGAGIGGGSEGGGGITTITGGSVTATGGDYGTGIGGGKFRSGDAITITGGIVTAEGGDSGAGIGGGLGADGGTITITGGSVAATGGDQGAGIGNGIGYYKVAGQIAITGGSVTATGVNGGAGIGGSLNSAGGNVTIDGGSVKATRGTTSGDKPAQNIGHGANVPDELSGTLTSTRGGGETLSRDVVTLDGSKAGIVNQTVIDLALEGYTGVNKTTGFQAGEYGIHDMKTDTEGKVYLYLPEAPAEKDQPAALWPGNLNRYAGTFDDNRTATLSEAPDGNLNLSKLDPGQNLFIWNNKYGVGADAKEAEKNSVSYKDDYTLTGGTESQPIQNTVTVMEDYRAGTRSITLNGLNIDAHDNTGQGAFRLEGSASVSLKLENANTLASGKNFAGLEVPRNATLTLDGSGSLKAKGGEDGAGMGGTSGLSVPTIGGGSITINGGTVTAEGGDGGAGIGSGEQGDGGTITINGGTVTAEGGDGGAGIGSGYFGDGGTIKITGGTVTAAGQSGGAGIGSGVKGKGADVTIDGGSVKATGDGNRAEDIGHGDGGTNSGTLTNGKDNVYRVTVSLAGVSAETPVFEADTPQPKNYGLTDVQTDNTGTLYFYLPADNTADPETYTTVSLKKDSATGQLATGDLWVADNHDNTLYAGEAPNLTVQGFKYTGKADTPQLQRSNDKQTLNIAKAFYKKNNAWSDKNNNIDAGQDYPILCQSEADSSVYGQKIISGTYNIDKADPQVTWPVADLTYGQMLSDSKLEGGKATGVDGGDLSGKFEWAKADIKPSVKDSGNTHYTMSFAPDNTNYTTAKKTDQTVTVHPAALEADGGTVKPKPYDGSPEAIVESVTFKGLKNNETLDMGKDYTVEDARYDTPDVGDDKTVTAMVHLTASEKARNYTLKKEQVDIKHVVITKADQKNLTITNKDTEYNPQGITLTTEGGSGDGVVSWTVDKVTGEGEISGDKLIVTKCGSFKLKATKDGDNNHNPAMAEKTITVSPEAPRVTWPEAALTYGQKLSEAELTGGKAMDANNNPISGSFVWESPDTQPEVSDSNTTDYTLRFEPEDKTNYQTAEKTNMKVIVNKADSTLEVTVSPASITYGDSFSLTAKPAIKNTLTKAADNTVDFYLGDPKENKLLDSATVANGQAFAEIDKNNTNYPDAGRVTIIAVYGGSGSLKGATGKAELTVNQAAGSGTVSLADWTYGEAANNPVPKSDTNGIDHVSYQYKEQGADDITYKDEQPTLPGSYTVKATFAATTNYKEVIATADFKISGKKLEGLSLSDATYPYDGASHSLEVKGEVPPECAVTYEPENATDAGDYPTTATVSGQGYEPLKLTATLHITAATPKMTITAKPEKEIKVGEPVELTVEVKGVKGDPLTGSVELLGQTLTLENGQATAEYKPENTNPTKITADYTSDDANYKDAQASITLTANKKVREDIIIKDATKIFGDLPFKLSPTGGSLQDGETYTYESNDTTVAEVDAEGIVTLKAAGSAQITVSVDESDAWNKAEATMTLTVNKGDIAGITFESQKLTANGKPQSIEISGSDLPDGASVSYTGNGKTESGVYPVTANIDGGQNYNNLVLTATMTIVNPYAPVKPTTPGEVADAIDKLPSAEEYDKMTDEEKEVVKEAVDTVVDGITEMKPEEQAQIPEDKIEKLGDLYDKVYNVVIYKDTSAAENLKTHVKEEDIKVYGAGMAAKSQGSDVKITITQDRPTGDEAMAFSLSLYVKEGEDYIPVALSTPIVIEFPLPESVKAEGLEIHHLNPDGTLKEILIPTINGRELTFMTTSFSNFLFVETGKPTPTPVPTPGPSPTPTPTQKITNPLTGKTLTMETAMGTGAVLLSVIALIALGGWQSIKKRDK